MPRYTIRWGPVGPGRSRARPGKFDHMALDIRQILILILRFELVIPFLSPVRAPTVAGMSAMPQPWHDEVPVEVHDRTLWAWLSALVAHRPALTTVNAAVDGDGRAAQRAEIASTARAAEQFAKKLSTQLLLTDAPEGAGSARAVAASVVRLCRTSAQGWSQHPSLAEFNREVMFLEACLDGIAARVTDSSQ